jgi:hypothetical protein
MHRKQGEIRQPGSRRHAHLPHPTSQGSLSFTCVQGSPGWLYGWVHHAEHRESLVLEAVVQQECCKGTDHTINQTQALPILGSFQVFHQHTGKVWSGHILGTMDVKVNSLSASSRWEVGYIHKKQLIPSDIQCWISSIMSFQHPKRSFKEGIEFKLGLEGWARY